MSEQPKEETPVIGDATTDAEARGTKIGESPKRFGYLPLTKKMNDLTREISSVEMSAQELASIRATLLLNFGATIHNHYGFTIHDEGSTHTMLMLVLTMLARNVGTAAKPIEPKQE